MNHVKIHRPILTEAERRRRENSIMAALNQFGKAMQKGRANEAKKD